MSLEAHCKSVVARTDVMCVTARVFFDPLPVPARSVKVALAKKAEMQIVGFNYQQECSFDVLQTGAGNKGAGAAPSPSSPPPSPQQPAPSPPSPLARASEGSQPQEQYTTTQRIQFLKELAELKAQGVISESEFELEKRRILQN
jgi:hypothetical protein